MIIFLIDLLIISYILFLYIFNWFSFSVFLWGLGWGPIEEGVLLFIPFFLILFTLWLSHFLFICLSSLHFDFHLSFIYCISPSLAQIPFLFSIFVPSFVLFLYFFSLECLSCFFIYFLLFSLPHLSHCQVENRKIITL